MHSLERLKWIFFRSAYPAGPRVGRQLALLVDDHPRSDGEVGAQLQHLLAPHHASVLARLRVAQDLE